MTSPQMPLDAGLEHHRAGRLPEAERAYRAAIAAEPANAAAHYMLGVLALQLGRSDIATEHLARAVELDDRRADFRQALGEAQRQLGQFAAARETLLRAVALQPDSLEAHHSLALALSAQATIEIFAEHPDLARPLLIEAAATRNNQGNLLLAAHRITEAEAAYRQGIELWPDYGRAWSNLGNVLRETGQVTQSEAACRRAIALLPDLAEAHNNLGNALAEQGRWLEAEAGYREALRLRPDLIEAQHNTTSGALLLLQYRSDLGAAEIAEAHRRWGRAALAGRGPDDAPEPDRAAPDDPERTLRIGYVSPDFREHSVSYFLEPLLANHRRESFEPFCYAEVAKPDAVTERLKALSAGWRVTVGRTDREVADMVRADGIDILVDLAGHTMGGRIGVFVLKPAPLTVTWLGYPGTTGLPNMDYRLTDAIADPPGEADRLHTEKLVRLPDGFLCYRPPPNAPAPATRDGADPAAVTFGSFNNVAKVTPDVIAAWSAILVQLPKSRLMLKGKLLADAVMRARLVQAFIGHGVRVEQLDLRPQTPSTAEHLALYGEVDIALDTFPYNGTTTTCEALWMGVPVITLKGDRHAARVGASILSRVGSAMSIAESAERHVEAAAALAADRAPRQGLRERLKNILERSPPGNKAGAGALIADGAEQYVKMAVALAAKRALRQALRQRLRNILERSPLRNEAAFALEVEAAFRDMWRAWCERR